MYDYHFLIEKLTKEFKGKIDCRRDNTEKYITFKVPLKKEIDNPKIITYKQKFIDRYRFMPTSLAGLVDNLSELSNKTCKKCMERKKLNQSANILDLKIID